MLQDRPAGSPTRRRRHRRLRVVVAILAVVAVVIGVLAYLVVNNAKNYYVFAPGTAPVLTASAACKGPTQLTLPDGTPCARIDLPASLVHPVDGKLYMVAVNVGPASPGEYLLNQVGLLGSLFHGYQLIPAYEYTGGAPPAQVQCADTAAMSSAQQDAPVAALRRLGYSVTESDRGAVVVAVGPGTPAAKAGIHCNDTITAIDGHPVATAEDLVSAIHARRPGDVVSLTRQSAGTGGKPVTATVHARLETTPAADAKQAGDSTHTAFLGIQTATNVTYHLPVHININAGNIGGPSAGLAFTLGVIDLMSGGDLTGGHRVAVTGEIDTHGNVISVGGVAQKAITVARAGATAFIVPKSDLSSAESAHTRLKLLPVTTLDQALADLKSMGGTVPPTDFATHHPAPAG